MFEDQQWMSVGQLKCYETWHYVQVGRMGYVPAYGGNGNSRNVSCSKPSLHCHKRPWEGALYKWLTRSAYGAI